ncbi:hypothetical protein ACIHFD_49820 [Nonomuraea sp. NPDC051941]|uniref:hypothetical protein n=1 Tax=Nonomuraea sp. NPDC051941 TaxID=3364373 RepID=UPI0037C925DC
MYQHTPSKTRAARRRARALHRLYRERLGGAGSVETVAGDVVADILLGLPDPAWRPVLQTGLRDAIEDRHGEELATHLELVACGLRFCPEGW